MIVIARATPALLADPEALMRQLNMPYTSALASELIATARAQDSEPVEATKALLVDEVSGRSRSMLATRRRAVDFPTGKTFDIWDESACSIPVPTQHALRTLEWIGRKENVVVCGPSGTERTFFLEALGQQGVKAGMRVAWFRLEGLGALIHAHRPDDSVGRVFARIFRAYLIAVDDIGCSKWKPTRPKGFIGSSTPHTRNARSRCSRTCIRPASIPSCSRPSRPRPLTNFCTTPTSARPRATPSGSHRPSPGRGRHAMK